jgi:polyisoprenoid-binding protein YceI
MLETVEALDFPEVVFSGAAKEKTSTGWKIVGELTFHGITRPLEMEMKKTSMNGKERFVGTFTLKLSDFNVDRPSLLFVSVADEFRVDVDLLAP